MQIHQLKPKAPLKRKRRVGRGDKTAGRGTKGQKARAGAKIRPALRDIIKRIPKMRGYRFHSFRSKPAVIDLKMMADSFPSGGRIDPDSLLEKGLIRKIKGRIPAVKILGSVLLKKKLNFKGISFSRSARAAVDKAGGTVQ